MPLSEAIATGISIEFRISKGTVAWPEFEEELEVSL
jgi:hypothetical protein